MDGKANFLNGILGRNKQTGQPAIVVEPTVDLQEEAKKREQLDRERANAYYAYETGQTQQSSTVNPYGYNTVVQRVEVPAPVKEEPTLTDSQRGSLMDFYFRALRGASYIINDYEPNYEKIVDELLNSGLSLEIDSDTLYYNSSNDSFGAENRLAQYVVRHSNPANLPYTNFDRIKEELVKAQLGPDYMDKITFKKITTFKEYSKLQKLETALNSIRACLHNAASGRMPDSIKKEPDEKKKKELIDEYMKKYEQESFDKEFNEVYSAVFAPYVENNSNFKDLSKPIDIVNRLMSIKTRLSKDKTTSIIPIYPDYYASPSSAKYEEAQSVIDVIKNISQYRDNPRFQEFCLQVYEVRGFSPDTDYAIKRTLTEMQNCYQDQKWSFDKIENSVSTFLNPHFDIQMALIGVNQSTYTDSKEAAIEIKNRYAGIAQNYDSVFELFGSNEIVLSSTLFADAYQPRNQEAEYLAFKTGLKCLEKGCPNVRDAEALAADKEFWHCYKTECSVLLGLSRRYIGDSNFVKETPMLPQEKLDHPLISEDVAPVCESAFERLYRVRQDMIHQIKGGSYNDFRDLLVAAYTDTIQTPTQAIEQPTVHVIPQEKAQTNAASDEKTIMPSKEEFNAMSPQQKDALFRALLEQEQSNTGPEEDTGAKGR